MSGFGPCAGDGEPSPGCGVLGAPGLASIPAHPSSAHTTTGSGSMTTACPAPFPGAPSSLLSTKGRCGSGSDRELCGAALATAPTSLSDPNAFAGCLRTPPQRVGDPNAPMGAGPSVFAATAASSPSVAGEGSGYGSLRDHLRGMPTGTPWQSPTALGVLGATLGSPAPLPPPAPGPSARGTTPPSTSPVGGHKVIRGPSFSLGGQVAAAQVACTPQAPGGVFPVPPVPSTTASSGVQCAGPGCVGPTLGTPLTPTSSSPPVEGASVADLASDFSSSRAGVATARPPRHCMADGSTSRPSSRTQDAPGNVRKVPAFSINSPPLAPAGTDLDAIEPFR